MIRPTCLSLRRYEASLAVHASIDGAAVGYFSSADDALFSLSTSARLPGWWPAASSPSQALIDVIPMARIEAIAARFPRPFATGAR